MGRQTGLTVALQDLAIRSQFPGFTYQRENKIPTWRGSLQPTEESPVYRIRLTYPEPRSPRVWVITPQLHPDAPHRYPGDRSLCLYYPNDTEAASWSAELYIADTIIPWTALWLAFYELWLETGVER